MLKRCVAILAVVLVGGVVAVIAQRDETLFTVVPSVETTPVPSVGDAADDIAVWVDPTDPARSVIVGTNKRHDGHGGLFVYGLDGKLISSLNCGPMNNVDGRYGFSLGGKKVDIFAATNRGEDRLDFFVFDPKTQRLSAAGSIGLADQSKLTGFHDPYGVALYHDVKSAEFHVFVSDYTGRVVQFRLKDENGKITGDLLRHWAEAGIVEGMVADEVHGHIFIGEESGGVFRYKAINGRHGGAIAAAAPDDRVVVDTTSTGHLAADVEGLAIYDVGGGGGYLIVSSQGNDRYVIYDRKTLAYIATFKIGKGNGVDGVNDTDGIEAISGNFGRAFPVGMFIAQDGSNDEERQNFKVVSWQHIVERAKAQGIRLDSETKFDPRKVKPAQ